MVLLLAGACAPVQVATLVDTGGVAIDPEGDVWFVKRYRLPERPDALYLVRCTRDDPPDCIDHKIEGTDRTKNKPNSSEPNTSGSHTIPM